MGRTADQGLFIKLSPDHVNRIHRLRGKRDLTTTGYIREALNEKLLREEEEERRIAAEKMTHAERTRERRHLKSSSGLGVASSSPIPEPPPPSEPDAVIDPARAATYALAAGKPEERDRRLDAIAETIAVVAPDPAQADAWIRAIRERVAKAIAPTPTAETKPSRSILPDFFTLAKTNGAAR